MHGFWLGLLVGLPVGALIAVCILTFFGRCS